MHKQKPGNDLFGSGAVICGYWIRTVRFRPLPSILPNLSEGSVSILANKIVQAIKIVQPIEDAELRGYASEITLFLQDLD
jgi:hypothetical protein